jgi:hypothetical protein
MANFQGATMSDATRIHKTFSGRSKTMARLADRAGPRAEHQQVVFLERDGRYILHVREPDKDVAVAVSVDEPRDMQIDGRDCRDGSS